jgi:hypothetical protein
VAQLFDKETIEGEDVTKLIEAYEEENGMETKITPDETKKNEKDDTNDAAEEEPKDSDEKRDEK